MKKYKTIHGRHKKEEEQTKKPLKLCKQLQNQKEYKGKNEKNQCKKYSKNLKENVKKKENKKPRKNM